VFGALEELRAELGPFALIHGACGVAYRDGMRIGMLRGADWLAHDWANRRALHVYPMAVDHDLDGEWPGAGPRRNARMVAEGPSVCVVFPGGRGTADCARRAEDAGARMVWVSAGKVVTPKVPPHESGDG
jgi:hypothetical protein